MDDLFGKNPAASNSIRSMNSKGSKIGSMAILPVLPAGGEIIRVCS